ncbi:thiamine pyrophosphate-dependent enzyme [Allobranchiibius sp. CTAmp26]|uniref:thiamine pyrophosphate-dependent enzyme n=1 Tax=Allobranchiibius sp. CTAmp26 TaxID=2815214 RepID=UPI001AA11536|nr:thiamine pyrophosphate-dependent enzyme [Allobranchiibius sp. CTAmp26]MBO1755924.1 pyruvate oxidase [Allobranchiibius sp. CTAmp26]
MNVAENLIAALADHGVTTVWGVVGDALNPVTDAIRREDRIEWIGVRHEEAAAFAAGAQAQLTGTIGVCMGTVGPGSIHLLNGLYDAKKSHAPVLAVCGQVPTEEMGSEFFQEVNNDVLFSDVSVFTHTVTSAAQMPQILEQAVNTAYAQQGVAVLTLPGDIGDLKLEDDAAPRFAPRPAEAAAPVAQIQEAARVLADADAVTLLVGRGGRESRQQVLDLADRLQAPMVLTLKAKEGLEHDNPYAVGQSGLIGNPAAAKALDDCDVLFLVGTDFPYREWLPKGKTVIQLNSRAEHIGRRINVEHALVGHVGPTLDALLPQLPDKRPSGRHLDKATKAYATWHEAQQRLTDPDHDKKLLGRLRSLGDNPDKLIRPEIVAQALNEHADPDAIFTSDTGMSTVWLSRFIEFSGTRRLLGSYNLGSMANAMPQALGAQALDRSRQVIACCGDGGLMMLLGDLRTAVTYDLPATFVVFDNGRLGMVKLEQEQGGLPEFGTELDNPDIAAVAAAMGLDAVRVTDPDEVAPAIQRALASGRPALLDIVTNPDEVSIPPKPKVAQAWGFAIAKSKETIESA